MFGIWKRKKPDVWEHKYRVVDNFESSTGDFYDAIQHELAERRLEGLEISRIEYAEGGLLSAKREYLRMRRERLVFDVCSAPFGTTWFFSWRFSLIPCQLMLWEILLVLLVLAGAVFFYQMLFGLLLGSILFGASLLSLLIFMRNTVTLGLQDIDAALLQIPIVGAFYETFLRKDSYFREDTRLAYVEIVRSVIMANVAAATGEEGVRLEDFLDAKPPSHPALLSMVADLLRMGRH